LKRKNLYKFLYMVSVLLVLGFIVRFGVDIYKYDYYTNSAPLYVYALLRAVVFILPSAIIFIVAIILKNKCGK